MSKERYPLFITVLKAMGLPPPQTEYIIEVPDYLNEFYFNYLPKKHWRIDYFWPNLKIAVEIDGGAFLAGGGGHNRGAGFRRDIVRHNTFTSQGITLFRFMPEHLPTKSTYAVSLLMAYFREKGYTL